MTVKLRATIILTISFLCVIATVSGAGQILAFPAEFYGTVYIDGSPAPAGTNVTSIVDNNVTGSIITSIPGAFGGDAVFDPRLFAIGTTDGQLISFEINGIRANQSAVFHPGTAAQIMVSIGVPIPETPVPTTTTVPPNDTPIPPTGQPGTGSGSTSEYYQSAQSGGSGGSGVDGLNVPMNPGNRILPPGPVTSAAITTPATAVVPTAQLVSAEELTVIPTTVPIETPQTSRPTTSAPGYSAITFAGLVVVCIGYRIARSWL